jgi:hypothetical protein
MTEVPYPTVDERLAGNIKEELTAQRAMSDLPLTDQQIDQLASAIRSNVLYGFEVRWSPRWVKGDDPHHWVEDADSAHPKYFVECLRHERITVHDSEAAATEWWSEHQRTEH